MCGFCGFSSQNKALLEGMSTTLKPRAVDTDTYYYTPELSLYHAHLKIADLDKDTSQPLTYEGIVISFVGEIYNKEYLLKMAGEKPEGATELFTLAVCFKKFGPNFINYVNGEFAIFIYDTTTKTHYFFRDRWGVKTLYYRIFEGQIYFSSEIKSLLFTAPKISREGLIDYLVFQYTVSPHTIFDQISSLEPGTWMSFSNGEVNKTVFAPYKSQEQDNGLIDCLITSTIRRIPTYLERVFVSLSGGPDSTFILHTLHKHFAGEIIAYSLLTQANKTEIDIAQKNTKKLSIKHLIIPMDDYDHQGLLEENQYTHEGLVYCPNILQLVKSQFPQYKDVKVEFSGDGKEEVFLTNRHFPYEDIVKSYQYLKSQEKVQDYTINHEFLNVTLFDFNLRLIDKVTLRNGVERRLPYTDYELYRYRDIKDYKPMMVRYLQEQGLEVVEGERGFFLGLKLKFMTHKDILGASESMVKIFESRSQPLYAN